MKKVLRISWLVVASIALLPLFIVFELIWLVCCICAAKMVKQSILMGLQTWYNYLKSGIAMNADFVKSGL